jgi:protein TonB
MKKILTIFACVAALALTTSCESKKEKEEKEAAIAAAKADSTQAANAIAVEERRARIKRERDELAERRRLAAEEKAKASATYKDATGKIVYYKSDVLPVFRGSEAELEQYIQDNVNYPTSAQADQVEGTVLVEFVVGADGVVRDVEVAETTSDAVKEKLSEEAVRVVSTMPTWTAGTQGGKPVAVRVSLPITFQLEM